MKKIFSHLKILYSPAFIGVYVTLAVVFSAIRFYEHRYTTEGQLGQSPFMKLIRIAHQKSVDLRLQTRGPRPGSDQVGLLTIDERSVATIGRWPWPREKVAAAIESAMAYGAK